MFSILGRENFWGEVQADGVLKSYKFRREIWDFIVIIKKLMRKLFDFTI